MAHELEIAEDGRVASVSGNNISPWHQLGTILPTGLTADDVLDKAYLRGWDVRKEALFTLLPQVTDDGVHEETVEVPGQFAVVRTNPFTKKAEVIGDPGGVVGRIYKPFQNEQAVDFLAAVTDTFGDAEYETAGSIERGGRTFVSMHLKDFTVGGVDGMKQYLVYMCNHVTGANLTFVTNIRPVCKNTVDWGKEQARYTFRHSASIETRHQQVRDALRLAFNYDALFQAEAEKLIQAQMDLGDFQRVCDEIWQLPQPEGEDTEAKKKHERALRRWSERRLQLKNLFVFAETQEDIRFTRWGAYNAIVEFQDHVAASGGRTAAEKVEARALRTIDGGGSVQIDGKAVNVKSRAYELLKVS
jgi:phage/plasmid-like protein (TIGR03299 family)